MNCELGKDFDAVHSEEMALAGGGKTIEDRWSYVVLWDCIFRQGEQKACMHGYSWKLIDTYRERKSTLVMEGSAISAGRLGICILHSHLTSNW